MVQDLAFLSESAPFDVNLESVHFKDCLSSPDMGVEDSKRWLLLGNCIFSVKSFYSFLIDGGFWCPAAKFFWRRTCPRKLNLFNLLSWKNKVLSLENLVLRRCNRLPTATCVLCHSEIETVNHLFLNYNYTRRVWEHFIYLFQLPEPPGLMSSLWDSWRMSVQPTVRDFCDLLVKACLECLAC